MITNPINLLILTGTIIDNDVKRLGAFVLEYQHKFKENVNMYSIQIDKRKKKLFILCTQLKLGDEVLVEAELIESEIWLKSVQLLKLNMNSKRHVHKYE